MDLSYDYSDLGWAAREMTASTMRFSSTARLWNSASRPRRRIRRISAPLTAVGREHEEDRLVLKKMAKPRDALSELQQAAARYGS